MSESEIDTDIEQAAMALEKIGPTIELSQNENDGNWRPPVSTDLPENRRANIAIRRAEVLKRVSTGQSMDSIAKELGVAKHTVWKDYTYMKAQASEFINNFVAETVPFEIVRALARMNRASDRLWQIADDPKKNNGDPKVELAATIAARDTAKMIAEFITDNQSLIDAVYLIRDRNKLAHNTNVDALVEENLESIDKIHRQEKSTGEKSDIPEPIV